MDPRSRVNQIYPDEGKKEEDEYEAPNIVVVSGDMECVEKECVKHYL